MREEAAALCCSDTTGNRSCCQWTSADDVKQQFLLRWTSYKKYAKTVQRNFLVDKNIVVSLHFDLWIPVRLPQCLFDVKNQI